MAPDLARSLGKRNPSSDSFSPESGMCAATYTNPTTDGSTQALSRVLSQIAKVAPSDSTVLILGETGTGKELIARAIHKRSKRAERAFIGVNCAAIPPSSITSDLFGYEKGAFTGATQRRLGRFESANGGTISWTKLVTYHRKSKSHRRCLRRRAPGHRSQCAPAWC